MPEAQLLNKVVPVRDRFQELALDVEFNEQTPERSSVVARIATASITTNQERRDAHLKSAHLATFEAASAALVRQKTVTECSLACEGSLAAQPGGSNG